MRDRRRLFVSPHLIDASGLAVFFQSALIASSLLILKAFVYLSLAKRDFTLVELPEACILPCATVQHFSAFEQLFQTVVASLQNSSFNGMLVW